MSDPSSDELFRQAAEAEGGAPVSAGARRMHIRLAIESGRAFYVDLSNVPEDKRAEVIAQIQELVTKATTADPRRSARHPRTA
jgi:hypothetical protein